MDIYTFAATDRGKKATTSKSQYANEVRHYVLDQPKRGPRIFRRQTSPPRQEEVRSKRKVESSTFVVPSLRMKASVVVKDLRLKDKDKDKDFMSKDEDKDKDLSFEDKDKDKDLHRH